jgi:hypothetical protein
MVKIILLIGGISIAVFLVIWMYCCIIVGKDDSE